MRLYKATMKGAGIIYLAAPKEARGKYYDRKVSQDGTITYLPVVMIPTPEELPGEIVATTVPVLTIPPPKERGV